VSSLQNLSVHIYADGANRESMIALYENPLIRGLTTNPTLMRKAGIADYEAFARDVLEVVTEKPISFEVFSDHVDEARREALKIAAWQSNVFVKVPITNTHGESCLPLIAELAADGVQLNVTALLTVEQVRGVAKALHPDVAAIVSIFAGRIADTGVSPEPIMRESLAVLDGMPKAELLWASVREVLNIYQADACGCDIVTVPHDILEKALKMSGMNLDELSLDTVRMFARDAQTAGYKL
jgi:transaldolase